MPLATSNVLEIGPGHGRFLQLVAKRGAKVAAIEPSLDFQAILVEQNIDIVGDFLEMTTTPRRFDIIMLFQVLEHFYDPVDAVRRIRQLLTPDGIVVLDVPNIWKPFRNLDRYFLRYVHLSYFSPQTLKHLFASEGFECVMLEEGGNGIYSANPLYGIFRSADEGAIELEIHCDDCQALLRHLRNYRRRYPMMDAPRIALHQIYRTFRRTLSRSPIGDVYRKLKSLKTTSNTL